MFVFSSQSSVEFRDVGYIMHCAVHWGLFDVIVAFNLAVNVQVASLIIPSRLEIVARRKCSMRLINRF